MTNRLSSPPSGGARRPAELTQRRRGYRGTERVFRAICKSADGRNVEPTLKNAQPPHGARMNAKPPPTNYRPQPQTNHQPIVHQYDSVTSHTSGGKISSPLPIVFQYDFICTFFITFFYTFYAPSLVLPMIFIGQWTNWHTMGLLVLPYLTGATLIWSS